MTARGEETDAGRAELVLLAKNAAGYINLMHIASRAWLDPAQGDLPHVRFARLEGRTRGPDRADRRAVRPA